LGVTNVGMMWWGSLSGEILVNPNPPVPLVIKYNRFLVSVFGNVLEQKTNLPLKIDEKEGGALFEFGTGLYCVL